MTHGMLSVILQTVILFSLPCVGQTPGTSAEPANHPVFPTGTVTPLGTQIAALLADPGVSRAHWGIAVMAIDGTPLYGFDEGKLFRPASNAKLFTTAAAMAMLGPDKRFTTGVVAEGSLTNGTLHGDLVLRGGGDANFASGYTLPYVPPAQRIKVSGTVAPDPLADLDDLAAQVAAKGVRRIDGDIVGDDTRFEHSPYPEGWSTDDLLWGYGAPVSALTIHDNQLDLRIEPAPEESSAKPTITLTPAVPFYTVNETPVDGHLWSVGTQDLGRNEVLEQRVPNERDFQIFGYVDAKYGAYTDELAIDRPAEFAAAALRQALERHGIVVKGGIRARHYDSQFLGSESQAARATPNEVTVGQPGEYDPFATRPDRECQAQRVAGGPEEHLLAEKESVPLVQDLTLTLKVSQNLHAEIMLRNAGVNRDCIAGLYLHTALAWERAFLVHAGIDGGDFVFYDGSGLSTKDLVTPRAAAQLLAYATKQPWFAQWKAALPVGGEDGTLSSRFPDAPLKDHLFAKTGTLGESRGLSGYVDAASGREVIFSIFVDDHAPNGSNDRVVMDKIVAAIAANE
jgi:D-alanyl-D-alanine carboxypeptidase/D-alanyl-D-alanine-endopeptidase (penicillin-binding protein 4)